MYTCIIIDDEPLAIDVLKSHIERSAILEIVSVFTSPVKALSFLEKQQVDLVFMDIQMPRLTGLQLIEQLQKKTKFIITSAYREYALEGFELDVLDFLVKPIAYERFLKSISKLIGNALPQQHEAEAARFIFIKENKRMTKIFLDEIVFLESQKDHLKIVTVKNEYMTRGTISYYEQWLPKNEYVRVHRSFIVAISKITHYAEEDIALTNNVTIPVGDLYRKGFREIMQRHLR